MDLLLCYCLCYVETHFQGFEGARLKKCDLLWHIGEQVASDIRLISDSTQCIMLLSCTLLHYFVQTLNGRQALIDIVCRMDEWFTSNWHLPVACLWQIDCSSWLSRTILAYTVDFIWNQSDVICSLFRQSKSQMFMSHLICLTYTVYLVIKN